jgi:hypothetical protein
VLGVRCIIEKVGIFEGEKKAVFCMNLWDEGNKGKR